MNADEIVRALRNYATAFGPTPLHIRDEMEAAADLIESLQAQLSASQRREKAAVEDLQLAAKETQEGIGGCVTCKHYSNDMGHGMPQICDQCASSDLCMYEWRGPQGAGEGSK